MRTLGIDYGSKRVGIAISDAGGKWATPVDVVASASALDVIRKTIAAEGVERIVMGLPLNMDGSSGAAARDVIAWAKGLGGAELVFVDERLSSFEAEQSL